MAHALVPTPIVVCVPARLLGDWGVVMVYRTALPEPLSWVCTLEK